LISICIPTHNTDCTGLLKSLSKQIKSLDAIIEVIVFDDGSTLHQLSNKTVCNSMGFLHIEHKENLGRVASRKKLAEMSKHQYLLFIDADMIPKNTTFLTKYHDFALTQAQVVLGGYAYEKDGSNKNLLRYKYGIKREEKKAVIRTKRPFKNIYSGNVLIKKELFLKTNKVKNNRYGLDCVFSASLRNLKIIPIHIDNETYHNGIESNTEFLKKAREGVKTIAWLYQKNEITYRDNGLVYVFNMIEKIGLVGIFKLIGQIAVKPVESLLSKNKAPLFLFDLYRLYHFTAR
jgi:glycosyltransferase involved in cell wall biosynthesis